jgi:hypothetical protein
MVETFLWFMFWTFVACVTYILLIKAFAPKIYAAGMEEMWRQAGGGPPNPQMGCPHCRAVGTVVATPVTVKTGISGAKAAGAVLTGGSSVLVTGLSKKQQATSLRCQSCQMTWAVS